MAINQNHTVEELNGVRCAIVEKNISLERAEFLKTLLEFNKYQVIVAVAPPPKAAPAKPLAEGEVAPPPPPPAPEKFIVGVTDFSFNAINAVFSRMLHSLDGHIVTQAYWYQKESVSHDEIPYYERNI
ncbi:MAG TPA: hypothetical protein VHP12_10080 [Chitinophagaceae bacterium]|nr:hypothetical protein [Chitinophagaceae bacterium]